MLAEGYAPVTDFCELIQSRFTFSVECKTYFGFYCMFIVGWGVRSLAEIPQGSFVCEYTGWSTCSPVKRFETWFENLRKFVNITSQDYLSATGL